jgi:hypothetical protein
MDNNMSNVGQGKATPEPVDAYDQAHGKYEGNVPRTGNEDPNLPTDAMPKGPDPSPFSLGPMGGGK